MTRPLRSVVILLAMSSLVGFFAGACARRVSSPTNGLQVSTEKPRPRVAAPALSETVVNEVLQNAFAALPENLLQFAPPSDLIAGEKVRVEARLARPILEELNKSLLARGWKVDALVGVRLSGDPFEINPLGPEDQMVGAQEFTVWAWDVRPLVAGAQVLRLQATLRVVTGSGAQYKALPVVERPVTVGEKKTGGFLKFLQSYWAWILGVILVAGIVAILVIEPSNKKS